MTRTDGRITLRYVRTHPRQEPLFFEETLTAEQWEGLARHAPLSPATAGQLTNDLPGFQGEAGRHQLNGLKHFLATAKGPIQHLDFKTRQPLAVELRFGADGALRCYIGGGPCGTVSAAECRNGVLTVTSAETGATKTFTHRSHP
jgi:hypothetical protein